MAARVRCRQCGTENQVGFGTCFNCGVALSSTTTIRKGSVLAGRYEILSPLGRGGMGVVYKAHDRSLDELVAVKLLRDDLVATPDLARRFLSEIKLARRVRHPNVCAIHEYGESDGARYIAMEYVDGVNLRQVLEEGGPLPAGEAARIAAQIARGLSAIHAVGIVHRDLKTPNVMRDARGNVRLMDFGIAKSLDSETHATATGSIIGTPEYMSPEQARAEKVDVRSDIYSLGIVVYELLTGRVPFKAETPLGVLLKHLNDEPAWVDMSANVVLSGSVRAILERALAKTPGDRYQSAAEMASALDAMAGGMETASAVSVPRLSVRPQRTATALQPEDAPVPTATHVPTAVPTRPAASRHTARNLPAVTATAAAAPRPPKSAVAWAGVAALVVAAAAAWGVLAMGPAEEAASPDPGSLSAVANLAPLPAPSPAAAVVAPPRTASDPTGGTPPAAPRPAVAPRVSEPPRVRTEARPVLVPERVAPAAETVLPAPAQHLPQPAPPPSMVAAAPPTPEPPRPAAAEPAPAVAPAPRPVPAGRGLLLITVKPEADITIDGEPVGRMGKYTRPLTAGTHTVVFTHPKYEPLSRTLSIAADERARLMVDLKDEAVPKKK